MTAKDLTQEQREWFVANFDHTKNQELADHLGTSPRSVTRIARELGLWKTKEFVAAMQRNASEHAARANRLMGGNAGMANLLKYGRAYQFKPGESNKDRMDEEALREMRRKIGASRKETFRKERRRVIFGLEQKTNLRVVQAPKEKICLRNGLRKKGYEIARASNEAFITAETHRSEVMERRAISMGISFTSI
jgi:hypothetical protein